ncbi:MAG: M48 family metallopeptidase [Sedimentisphaerales bacterium]|nr:M48 family metallopeptidase [Sedimentisphaerales bacterium]
MKILNRVYPRTKQIAKIRPQTQTITLECPPVGVVIFAQTRRAKRLSISIRPFRPVRVAFPPRISLRKAKTYLQKNMAWVQKNLIYAKQVEAEHATTVTPKPQISRTASQERLLIRLEELARQYGFTYNRVSVRNQKTRWGSCSSKNNISLNVNLVKLQPELMDYVLLHELLHTRIKNHSKTFWAELDKYVAEAKSMDKRLKKHHLGL